MQAFLRALLTSGSITCLEWRDLVDPGRHRSRRLRDSARLRIPARQRIPLPNPMTDRSERPQTMAAQERSDNRTERARSKRTEQPDVEPDNQRTTVRNHSHESATMTPEMLLADGMAAQSQTEQPAATTASSLPARHPLSKQRSRRCHQEQPRYCLPPMWRQRFLLPMHPPFPPARRPDQCQLQRRRTERQIPPWDRLKAPMLPPRNRSILKLYHRQRFRMKMYSAKP